MLVDFHVHAFAEKIAACPSGFGCVVRSTL